MKINKQNLGWIIAGILVLSMLFISFASASIQTLGTFKSGEDINIVQTCTSCSFNNISAITYPNSTFVLQGETSMDNVGSSYNYTLDGDNSQAVGEYIVQGHGDLDGADQDWTYNFFITTNGEDVDLSNGIIIFAQICVMILFFGMGRIWNKKKWKLKMFFDILALLMVVITLNTTKIIATQSLSLSKMGDLGLIIGISLVSIMIAYFLVLMTIEIIQKLKKNKNQKWSMDDYAK